MVGVERVGELESYISHGRLRNAGLPGHMTDWPLSYLILNVEKQTRGEFLPAVFGRALGSGRPSLCYGGVTHEAPESSTLN